MLVRRFQPEEWVEIARGQRRKPRRHSAIAELEIILELPINSLLHSNPKQGRRPTTGTSQSSSQANRRGAGPQARLSFTPDCRSHTVVRYEGQQPGDPSAVEHTLIDTPSGAKIPLSAVAGAREDSGPNFIMREGVQRRIVVQCNVAGRDLRGVVNDIQKNVVASVNLPQGYRIEYGGQFESEAEASRRLLVLGIIV